MLGARPKVVHCVIHEIRRFFGLFLDFLPLPHSVCRLHIGTKNRLQAPSTAQLSNNRLSGDRINYRLTPPPPVCLQCRDNAVFPLIERQTLSKRSIQTVLHILEQVHVHHFCDGKRSLMLLCSHIGIAKRRAQTFIPKVLQGLL